jgi:putative thiamine transport system permease protein
MPIITHHSGRLLSLLLVAIIVVPIFPGLFWELASTLNLTVWQNLLSDPLLVGAAWRSLFTTFGSTLLATALALIITIALYPSRNWVRWQTRLPFLLAMPHAAFAVGFFFLISPSGWLARALAIPFEWISPPDWITVHDHYAISLTIALGLKECWFLVWALSSVLTRHNFCQQMTLARTLGYPRVQVWWSILLPQVLPRIAWPITAVFAYSLSVVDISMILGPTNPPTLAILAWRWLTDADPIIQAKGNIAAFLMLLFLIITLLSTLLIWKWSKNIRPVLYGIRWQVNHQCRSFYLTPLLGLNYLIIAILLLWSFSGMWFFPQLLPSTITMVHWWNANLTPLLTTLWLGIASCLITLPIALIWLEWGPKQGTNWVFFPLIVPALPLAAAQYYLLLAWGFDGQVVGLIWSHLLWVFPYMVLILIGPYRGFDARLMLTAQTLGHSRVYACLRIKWPMLIRPILAAFSIGFSVSVAQYLPTIFAGAGRFSTVTTEAISLSSGGNRPVLAIQSVLQFVLPMAVFLLATYLPVWLNKRKQGTL